MVKKLISLVIVLLVLVVVVVAVVFLYIDSIAKAGIEKGGTYALGVPTTVDIVDVSVFGGTFEMSGLAVANPSGFSADHFLTLNDAGMAVSLGTLREETVELPTFDLTGLGLTLERSGGKANYKAILENLKRFETGDGGGEQPPADGKKFVIKKLSVRDVSVDVSVEGLANVNLPIDEIILEDVGSGKGVPLGELANIIVKAIFAAVVERGGGIIPGDVLGELQGGLAQLKSLESMGIERITEVQDRIKEQTGALQDIGKGLDDVGKEAGKALEGVGNLFGGKKDK
ncbi:MAG: hypothetical protein GY715_05440 [Planctomycetes bacterium]|nr:hypothetical protein [Planctomycetota bacterium]